jgi:hypothetical protein
MDGQNAYTARATAGSVRVAIVDAQSTFTASSIQPILRQRPAGVLQRLGFGRTAELGLIAANATIWTWVAALPIGLV